jgi:hypothetical protein
MGREVISVADVHRIQAFAADTMGAGDDVKVPAAPKADDYFGRLVKYVPPDVIAAYVAIEGAIGAAGAPGVVQLGWIVFIVMLVATPLYLWRVGGVRKIPQLLISTLAFVVWALAFSGPPFAAYHIPGIYTTVGMGLFTFLVPLIET